MRGVLFACVVLCASILLAGCVQDNASATTTTLQEETPPPPPINGSPTPESSPTPSPSPTLSVNVSSSATITVTATNTETRYQFSPSQITVSPGLNVTIVFRNQGSQLHSFSIPTLNVDTGLVNPGQEKSVSFTAPSSSGTHGFLCTVGNHGESGMQGTLTIR